MKKILLFLSMLIIVTLACDLSVTVAPTIETTVPLRTNTVAPEMETATLVLASGISIPATFTPISTPNVQPSPVESTAVTFGRLSFVIPPSVANGASGKEYPRFEAEDAAYWQKTPGHQQVMLSDYYVLQGKFHQPQIYVYPAQAYAEMVPAAFESIRRINNILYSPGGVISNDQLPSIPFFNAKQAFASNIENVQFQNGSGVRFLTEYAQYAAPVNNYELFYHFQGVTRDGMYYIVAVFPITAPVLAETDDPGAAIPPGGIEYRDMSDPNADFPSYYASITDLLNATSNEVFTPSISQLDLLIQSMQIIP